MISRLLIDYFYKNRFIGFKDVIDYLIINFKKINRASLSSMKEHFTPDSVPSKWEKHGHVDRTVLYCEISWMFKRNKNETDHVIAGGHFTWVHALMIVQGKSDQEIADLQSCGEHME